MVFRLRILVLVLIFAQSGVPQTVEQSNAPSLQKPKIFPRVVITGCFKGYPRYDGWIAFIEPRSLNSQLEKFPSTSKPKERRAAIQKVLLAARERRLAAYRRGHAKVDSKGTFRLLLNNLKSGDYWLNFGPWSTDLSGLGCDLITVDSETINLGCHEADI